VISITNVRISVRRWTAGNESFGYIGGSRWYSGTILGVFFFVLRVSPTAISIRAMTISPFEHRDCRGATLGVGVTGWVSSAMLETTSLLSQN